MNLSSRDAATGSMKRGRAQAILGEVQDAVARWPEFADRARLPGDRMKSIRRAFRTEFAAR